MRRLLTLLGLPLLAACSRSDARSSGIIDSILPPDTALARFREGLTEPTALEGGVPGLTALTDSFVARVERADTAGLAALALTRAEFAYLYYPTVPESRPPYDLAPGLFWFMLEGNSDRGLATLLAERGGHPLGYHGVRCEGEPRRYGENTVWSLCLIRRAGAPGDTVAERLFGPIVERDGIFKFVSYANKL
jgi:hypothetical protein